MSDRTDQPGNDEPGPTVTRVVNAPVDAVWAVLADGWSYPVWVVGASRVREVDTGWPAVGTRIHHAFGPWPLVVQDDTRVTHAEPPSDLVMTARGWPVGEARVHLHLEPRGEGSCEVSITEGSTKGPGTVIPPPLRHLVLGPRKRETLYRLALLAEGRHRHATSS